jgi:DNA-binding transcriptional LysR family regulator
VEVRQLESFLAVSETLHFGQAAERLHFSQPALSRQVQKLERELGVALFERLGRRVVLTAAGRVLAEHARRVVAELEAARQAAQDLAQAPRGSLSIASFDSASVHLMPVVLAGLHERHPGTTVSVATLGTRDALRAVRDADLDAAIVTLPVSGDGVEVSPLFREEMVVALPPGHRLARQQRVPLEALGQERLVTFRPMQNTRKLIDRAFAAAGAIPRVVSEQESVEAMKDAVRGGLGVAILGKLAVRGPSHGAGLVVRPLSPALHRGVGLVTRAGRPPNPLLARFVETLLATAALLGLEAG